MIKLSVIVIVYNEEDNIPRCILSILNQNYKNFEFIIVNDGSTDNTESAIKQFKDKRIVYTKHPKNMGYASARNTGLKLAKGDYVFFTDADCIAPKGWLEEGLKFMQKNPEAVGVCGPTKKLSAKCESVRSGLSYIRSAEFYAYPFPSTSNVAYKRNVLRGVGGFDERYNSGCEDMDIYWKVIKRGKVLFCDTLVISHAIKGLSFIRLMSIAKRFEGKVCFLKDHSKEYPKLRRSHVCYGSIMVPSYFFTLFFPPLIFWAMKVNRKQIKSLKDVAFLIPFYFGLWYVRFIIWKTAIKERTFLI